MRFLHFFSISIMMIFGILPFVHAGGGPCHPGDFSNPVEFTSDLGEILKNEIVCSPTFDYRECGRFFNAEYRSVILCQSGTRYTDTKKIGGNQSLSTQKKRALALAKADKALRNAGFVYFSHNQDVNFLYNPNNWFQIPQEQLVLFFHYQKEVRRNLLYQMVDLPLLFQQGSYHLVEPFDFRKSEYKIIYEALGKQRWHLPAAGSAYLYESTLLKKN